jgi:hypothetical protein
VATVPCNDRRDAGQGPEGIAKAVGARPSAQEGEEVVALCETAFGVTATRMRCGVEHRRSMVRHGSPPAPARAGGGLDVSGHGPHAPAGLPQGDGDTASDFEWDACACGSHATRIGRRDPGL